MSLYSGIAAAGIAIALVLVAVGEPVWEWRRETSEEREVWSYGAFGAHHYLYNQTTGNVSADRDFTYAQLAATQPSMASVMGEFGQFLLLGLIAAFAGVALSIGSLWKKLRGIYAGVALLGACAAALYVAFTIVFTLPSAAATTSALIWQGRTVTGFNGQYTSSSGGPVLSWTPQLGWVLVIGAGLAFAWASSDLWHLVPSRKIAPKKLEVTIRRVPAATPPPPPPPMEAAPAVPPEPVIEEVFVIGRNGLLIKHMSRSLMSDKDRDVVGSMISAISSFVREAFTERDGEVHEVTLGDHRFVMCNDNGLVVAVLVTSGETEDITHRLRHLLAILKDRYGGRLDQWQGEPLEGIEDELGVLWEPYHLPPPPVA